ncbi:MULTISPECIES: hypothetical protein [Mycolicibacterium]|uniref:Uncharacterized protein n=1 Tax=Mycolicibacterium komossense TaxID=1779 RepID=A0ABT3C6T8_9MYCO|nr:MULTISPECIES: hypothetical protein [Mycolicibacterium]MCV7174557.1 hypothetical protein [Mycolicibacterium sphagni]MCV7225169.1 hypothetical protein [Mycolicibacterium komossense]
MPPCHAAQRLRLLAGILGASDNHSAGAECAYTRHADLTDVFPTMANFYDITITFAAG